jgi:transposase-like protein|tara:strand:+ start:2046 stop:2840 length:795 start_codon:yes stop_codon:yes gene_type:complete
MAETLTYQESEPNTESVVLNEAEQEALEVGEQMEKDAGNAKLAGKFDSPEQLEKAYMELQSKLGSNESSSQQSPVDEPQEETEAEEEPEQEFDSSFLDELYEQAQGEPSQETIEKLEKMDASQLADMYVQYRQQVESNQTTSRDFTEEQTNALYGIVGGQEQYGQLTSWASQNLSQQEVAMFDAVMETGDPNAAFWAIRSLAMQYADANGYEGKRISGKAPTSGGNQFRSQAELVQAMSDPRYENDDAYRADVMAKLERSELNF